MYWEVVRDALDDAGLSFADVDGLIGPAPDGVGIRDGLPGGAVADLLGHPLRFHASTSIGASGQSAGIGLAALAIANDMASVVVIPNVVAGGARRLPGRRPQRSGGQHGAAREPVRVRVGHHARRRLRGRRAAAHARVRHHRGAARRDRGGATPRRDVEPALDERARGEITIDDVVASRQIADPLKLLDCCLVNQGAGCIVMARTGDITAPKARPVAVLGWGEGHSHLDPCKAPSLAGFEGGRLAADTAFAIAGVSATRSM